MPSVAEFVAAMRRCELPEGGGWEAAARRAPDAEGLARELTRGGFLTTFQARQLLLGRGADLVIGPFLLLDVLGAGGMGQVFKARNRNMGRVEALKVMLPTLGEDAGVVARFRQEVRAASRLMHPNVVTAFHADSGPRGLLLAMEYCDGRDLGQAVRDGGPMAVARACDCAGQAAAGLGAAHAVGLVHRDVKPSNLLLTVDGVVKILDFGLARFGHEDDTGRLTHTGAAMGTPDFMAPEQARDSSAVDIRGDIYSLGCTLYFLLTGRVPFPGGTGWNKVVRHQTEDPEPVEALRPQVPPKLAAVVRRMMAKDPAARYQTPAEVVAALAAFHAALPPTVRVIPHGARLPPVAGEAAAVTVPDRSADRSSPFAFDTPAPVSDPSTPTGVGPPKPAREARRPARRRALWPLWGGALAGLVLAGVAVVLLSPRPAPDAGAKPGPAPIVTDGKSSEKKATVITKPVPPRPDVIDLPPFARDDGAGERIAVHRIAFHPKRSDLLAVARGQSWNPVHGGVEVWDVTTGKVVRTFGGGRHPPVFAVAFSGDGDFLAFAAGSPDADVRRAEVTVVRADTWEQRCRFETDSDGVLALAFTHGGHSHLVVGTQVVRGKGPRAGRIEVWSGGGDWHSPTRVRDDGRERVERDAPVTGVAMNPNGLNSFAAAEWDATARLWQAGTRTDPTRITPQAPGYEVPKGTGRLSDLAWSADGRLLAAVTAQTEPPDRGARRVLVWHSPAHPAKARLAEVPEIGYDFGALAFLPDGGGSAALATGDEEGRVRVWELPGLTERRLGRDLKLFVRAISAVAVAPDGRTLAVAGEGVGTTYQIRLVPLDHLRGK